jgi:putative ABC transport system permease protein
LIAVLAWLRVALRDLRGDLRRFGVLLACLALGVGTIAIVGSVGASMQAALARDARTILGGDLEASLSYRAANDAERALFSRLATVSEVIEVMGRARVTGQSAFVALRAVDANYPLLGSVDFESELPGASLADLLALRDGHYGAVVDSLLLDRMGLKLGDLVTIGEGEFQLRGVLNSLPDQVTQGVMLGIPTLVSVEGLGTTGILQPGVLAKYRYKMILDPPGFTATAVTIRNAFPDAGWLILSPKDATADLARFFDIFSRFLVIVGLSSLLVGGVGVSNAVSAYVTERQRSIATMRSLGATSGRILFHFLVQVMLLTLVGIGLGLILGAVLTLIALPIIGGILNIDLPAIVDPVSILTAAGFGLLIGFAFGYLPLHRAQALKPALLFRSAGSAVEGVLRWRDLLHPALWLPLLLALAAIYALAAVTTGRPLLVFYYAIGVALAFLVLRAAAWLLQHALRLVPPLPNAHLRNALKAIHRPGAPAPIVIMSLGLGLAMLLIIALVDGSLRHQLDRESIPDAPSFVFMDLFDDEAAELAAFASGNPQVQSFTSVPLVRGAITAINGTPVAERPRPDPEFSFLLEGEIPLSIAADLPAQSTVTEGEWWPAGYAGPPLLSVFDRLRTALGLKLGDQLTITIFGEPVTATITNFRDYVWRSGNVNFGFVLSPGSVTSPISYLGLLKSVPGEERTVQQAVIDAFPELIFIPVGEAIDALSGILAAVTNAVAVLGGLAVVSGLFVLAGAMAAGRRQREADAVVMKVLGASRGDVVRAYIVEYGLLGALAALLAAALGIAGSWAFVTQILEIDYFADPVTVTAVILGAVILTIAIGTLTTWSALSVRPARFLREE